MDTHGIKNFYKVLADTLPIRWSEDGLREVAALSAPEGLLGKNEWLLRADYSLTVGRWFIEGLVDLGRYAQNTGNIGHLYQEINSRLSEVDPHAPRDEVRAAAMQLSLFAWREVIARRGAHRERPDVPLRESVWFKNDPLQRCYLCGYRFTPHAKDLFLRRRRDDIPPLKLVDFTRPRGLNRRHLRVELDHVIPVAEGGETDEDNLRLACGWCNITKSSLWSVYDAKSWAAGVIKHPTLGLVTVPQPLWILRLVAARARCEASEGCGARLVDHELYVAPQNANGALTPTNLKVVCGKHDPWAGHRLVSPAILANSK
jgi:hypothetical protein